MKTEGYIYLIADESEQYCKIGISRNPRTRFRSIQTHCPLKLKLHTHSFVAKARAAEALVHYKLRESRLHGEWFKISPAEVSKVIAKVLSDPTVLELYNRYDISWVDRMSNAEDVTGKVPMFGG